MNQVVNAILEFAVAISLLAIIMPRLRPPSVSADKLTLIWAAREFLAWAVFFGSFIAIMLPVVQFVADVADWPEFETLRRLGVGMFIAIYVWTQRLDSPAQKE